MSNFITVWETLFGVYSPIQYVDQDNLVQYATDWGYVARVVFFIVIVYCVLRTLGGLINGKR